MLEDGVSHTFIQQLLGHRSPKSTDVYLQMTSKALMGIRSPFDTYREGLSDDDK
jgi:site-specific recombinase XerD